MRRKLLVLLGLAALVLLGYFLLARDFNTGLFLSSLSNVRAGWVIAAVLLTFLSYVIRSFRWQVLLIAFKRIGLGPLLTTTVLGFGAIYALGRAGEFVRPVWIARREGIPLSGSVATIAVERVFDMLMLVLLAGVGLALVELPQSADRVVSQLTGPLWASLSLAALALCGFIFLHRPVTALVARLPFRRIGSIVETFARGLTSTSDGRSLGLLLAYSVCLWSILALQFWLMLIGLDLDLGLAGASLVLVFTALGSLAQVPGVGGGFQAGVAFSLSALFGIQAEIAVAAALLVWIISFAPTLVVGAIYMAWKGISTRDLVVEPDSAATV